MDASHGHQKTIPLTPHFTSSHPISPPCSERDAARIMRAVVSVIEYCHSMGVCHRDLKPENFLFSDEREDAPLKAIDFGLSIFFTAGKGGRGLTYWAERRLFTWEK